MHLPWYRNSTVSSRPMSQLATLLLALLILLLASPFGLAQTSDDAENGDSGLADMPLEALMSIEITSVSRHAEKLSDSAAAVCVITQEDIRRSGLTTIPEILRMATGMQVAHIDSSKWAISSRGFTDRFSNKLLVLIDGRSVYTPFFSGVWWDVQDTSIDDIDRIEIIRGPGAALWGANAVNGIVNIITKKATSNTGRMMAVAELSDGGESGVMRLTGNTGAGSYRIYTKSTNHAGFVEDDGVKSPDSWRQERSGFRSDWELSDRDAVTVQGDVYNGTNKQTLSRTTLVDPYHEPYIDNGELSGSNCLARFTRTFSKESSVQLQMYTDRTYRKDGLHQETRNTIDLDLQHSFQLGSKQNYVWGLGYRLTKDNLTGNDYIYFSLESQKETLYSAFLQDEMTIVPDRLRVTLGSKVEYNWYTGTEWQPNVRLLWQPSENQTVWAAVSRAARTPSRIERDGSMNQGVGYVTDDGLPVVYVTTNNPGMKSEILTATELGYRIQPSNRFNIDTTAFYNNYDDFRSYDAGISYIVASPVPHIVQPLLIENNMNARTYGLEMSLNYRPTDNWRLTAGFTGLRMSMTPDAGHTDPVQATYPGDTPHSQISLRSYMDLSRNVEMDTMIYHVGELPHYSVPAYTRVDLRLGYRPANNIEVSLGVRNLLDSHHLEFGGSYTELATEVEREFYTKITRKF